MRGRGPKIMTDDDPETQRLIQEELIREAAQITLKVRKIHKAWAHRRRRWDRDPDRLTTFLREVDEQQRLSRELAEDHHR
jgi:hypothetical protein